MAWNQRCAHKCWDPEERYSQARYHFHNNSQKRDLHKQSSSEEAAPGPSFPSVDDGVCHLTKVLPPNTKGSVVPKVNVGVTPYEGAATKPKGSVVPKVNVGVAPYEGAATKPKGSVVPKVNVGVAPCKGAATKPNGSVAPKVNVGVAPCEGAATKPEGSVVPKVNVGVAPYEGAATKPKGCGEVEDVVGAVTPVVGGAAQVFHDLLVELRLLLVAEVEEGEEEDKQEES